MLLQRIGHVVAVSPFYTFSFVQLNEPNSFISSETVLSCDMAATDDHEVAFNISGIFTWAWTLKDDFVGQQGFVVDGKPLEDRFWNLNTLQTRLATRLECPRSLGNRIVHCSVGHTVHPIKVDWVGQCGIVIGSGN